METLRAYLNSLSPAEQHDYCRRAKTTVGYLRKAISIGQRLSEGLVIDLERESGGAVPCESLLPSVDWAYLRQRRSEPNPTGEAAV